MNASVDRVATCPKWGECGHNWLALKGWFRRRYYICIGCGFEVRDLGYQKWGKPPRARISANFKWWDEHR